MWILVSFGSYMQEIEYANGSITCVVMSRLFQVFLCLFCKIVYYNKTKENRTTKKNFWPTSYYRCIAKKKTSKTESSSIWSLS